MRFVAQRAATGAEIIDPLADTLCAVGRDCAGGAADVDRFLALEAVFPRSVAADPRFRQALAHAYETLGADAARALTD
jgi:fructuronate reductase